MNINLSCTILNVIIENRCLALPIPLSQWTVGAPQMSWQPAPSTPLVSAAAPSVKPVHSRMLSSHLFFCLPRLLPPWTVPCMIVLASPDDLVMWPYHLSLRCLTVVRRSSWGPKACRVLFRISSLVMWSLYVMVRSFLRHLISMACIPFSVFAINVQDSQAYRNMDMTRERISVIFELFYRAQS